MDAPAGTPAAVEATPIRIKPIAPKVIFAILGTLGSLLQVMNIDFNIDSAYSAYFRAFIGSIILYFMVLATRERICVSWPTITWIVNLIELISGSLALLSLASIFLPGKLRLLFLFIAWAIILLIMVCLEWLRKMYHCTYQRFNNPRSSTVTSPTNVAPTDVAPDGLQLVSVSEV
ncbi:hypothetical protein Ancab_031666 [Ancistrocladus abbreviatus]